MTKQELKNKIENIKITYEYDYEEIYTSLYNTVIDYMNDTQDFELEYLFEDFITYDSAEDRAKWELEKGGLFRLYYFLGNANLNNSLFKINGYGNLEDISKEDLDYLKEQILESIEQ